MAWWSSALTPAREGTRLIPNPGTPFPTLGIDVSTLFRDVAGWICLILKNGSIGSKKLDSLQKYVKNSQKQLKKKKIGKKLAD